MKTYLVIGFIHCVCLSTTASFGENISSGAPHAEVIVGTARVIDGDSLELDGKRIRLLGIDAPESTQICYSENGRAWPCGKAATEALNDFLSHTSLVCQSKLSDFYRRFLAYCRVGTISVNAWMVRQGLALAYRKYSDKYISEENAARMAKRGIWSGSFILPWQWRQGKRFEQR